MLKETLTRLETARAMINLAVDKFFNNENNAGRDMVDIARNNILQAEKMIEQIIGEKHND